MKTLVIGGSTQGEKSAIWALLDKVHAKRPITLVMHADRPGTEEICKRWAIERGVIQVGIPALALADGVAGTAMGALKLDSVIAFPGTEVTERLTALAIKAGLPVWWPADSERSKSHPMRIPYLFSMYETLIGMTVTIDDLKRVVLLAESFSEGLGDRASLTAEEWGRMSSVVLKARVRIQNLEAVEIDGIIGYGSTSLRGAVENAAEAGEK